MKKTYFFITMLEKIPADPIHEFGDTGNHWFCGYFEKFEDAEERVVNNVMDLDDGCYRYAIIQEIPIGTLNPHPIQRQFYQFNKEKQIYFKISEPTALKHYDVCIG